MTAVVQVMLRKVECKWG